MACCGDRAGPVVGAGQRAWARPSLPPRGRPPCARGLLFPHAFAHPPRRLKPRCDAPAPISSLGSRLPPRDFNNRVASAREALVDGSVTTDRDSSGDPDTNGEPRDPADGEVDDGVASKHQHHQPEEQQHERETAHEVTEHVCSIRVVRHRAQSNRVAVLGAAWEVAALTAHVTLAYSRPDQISWLTSDPPRTREEGARVNGHFHRLWFAPDMCPHSGTKR
jgi:hypothetical protein